MALILLVENMTTRWRYLRWSQSWPPDSATCIANTVYWFQSWLPGCIICIVTLPFCLGLPYWHHQLVLSCNSHQPESHQLGTPVCTNIDEFLEKFQTAFEPPPSFSENHVANLYQFHAQKALFKGPKSAT